MLILDGKLASRHIKDQLKQQIINLQGKRKPHLVAILVGSDGASETYVASKIRSCEEIGFQSSLCRMPADTEESALLNTIKKYNAQPDVDGILVQLPLPKHISEQKVIETIDPQKDVDGFHTASAGRLVLGLPTFVPATPLGVMLMLEYFDIDTKGKHAVIIGRSNIVGRPMSILLSSNLPKGNCTVTLCHSHTKNLEEICRQADIIVAALGKPGFVSASMVKEGAVVIDVGITRVPDPSAAKGYRIRGDVDYNEVAPKASAITPVPGGVGLMTIAGLLQNTMEAYKRRVTEAEPENNNG